MRVTPAPHTHTANPPFHASFTPRDLHAHQMCSFGDFILDPASGSLWRKGIPQEKLTGLPLELLLILLKRPTRVTPYAQIRQKLHPKAGVASEVHLRKVLQTLRKRLDDDHDAPRYIKTCTNMGLMFMQPVSPCASPESPFASPEPTDTIADHPAPLSEPPVATPVQDHSAKTLFASPALPEPPSPRQNELPPIAAVLETPPPPAIPIKPSTLQSWTALPWLLLAGALVAIVSVFLWRAQRDSAVAPPAQALSIAVLPIVNLSGEPGNDYMADGLTNAVISSLETMAGSRLRVTAFSTSMTFKGKKESVNEVGSELKVAYVLEGSLLRLGGSMRAHIDLRRTADESQVTAGDFDMDAENMPASASIFARKVLAALPLRPSHSDTATVYVSPSSQARDAFLHGQHYLWLRTHEGLGLAVPEFRAATEADPSYAQAFSQLSITYLLLGGYGWMQQSESAEKGKTAFESALKLNEKDADAHAAKGYYSWFYQWDWATAEKELKRAIELNPSDVNALHWYALTLLTSGERTHAKELIHQALTIDPKSQILQTNLGWIDFFAGDAETASTELKNALREDPGFLSARLKLMAVSSFLNHQNDAFEQLKFMNIDSSPPYDPRSLDAAYKAGGYWTVARSWARQEDENSFTTPLIKLEIAALAGDSDNAVRLVQENYKAHDGWLVFIAVDPALDKLRHDPRVSQIFDEIERKRRNGTSPQQMLSNRP